MKYLKHSLPPCCSWVWSQVKTKGQNTDIVPNPVLLLRQDLCRAPKRILPHIYEASTSFLRFSIPPETDTEIFFQKGARHKFLDCERGRGTLLLRKRAQKSSAFPELLLLKKRTQKSKSTEKSGNKGGKGICRSARFPWFFFPRSFSSKNTAEIRVANFYLAWENKQYGYTRIS